MKTCKWYKSKYGWQRIREGESLLTINGENLGSIKVYWDNINELTETLMTIGYKRDILLPEEEVFV